MGGRRTHRARDGRLPVAAKAFIFSAMSSTHQAIELYRLLASALLAGLLLRVAR